MPSRPISALLAAAALVAGGAIAGATVGGGEPSRQEVVADRGARVMPFSLDATIHVFDATALGGTQRVVAKEPQNSNEIRLIREHLREEATAFRRGDFADPASIHGDDMPGLDVLRAGYQDIDVRYRGLPDGADIAYRTADPELAAAVRAWFDAQLRDHAGAASNADSAGADHTSHPGHQE